MSEMFTASLVRLGAPPGGDKETTIAGLAGVVAEAGRTDDPDRLVQAALAREQLGATGLPGGVAIPHCRTTAVQEPTLAFTRLSQPVDFGATDSPADLVFLIASPVSSDEGYLEVLTHLARALVTPNFPAALRQARTADAVVEIVHAVLPR